MEKLTDSAGNVLRLRGRRRPKRTNTHNRAEVLFSCHLMYQDLHLEKVWGSRGPAFQVREYTPSCTGPTHIVLHSIIF